MRANLFTFLPFQCVEQFIWPKLLLSRQSWVSFGWARLDFGKLRYAELHFAFSLYSFVGLKDFLCLLILTCSSSLKRLCNRREFWCLGYKSQCSQRGSGETVTSVLGMDECFPCSSSNKKYYLITVIPTKDILYECHQRQ